MTATTTIRLPAKLRAHYFPGEADRAFGTQPDSGSGRKAYGLYGQTGYIALYRFVAQRDEVRILALRHQRELWPVPSFVDTELRAMMRNEVNDEAQDVYSRVQA